MESLKHFFMNYKAPKMIWKLFGSIRFSFGKLLGFFFLFFFFCLKELSWASPPRLDVVPTTISSTKYVEYAWDVLRSAHI